MQKKKKKKSTLKNTLRENKCTYFLLIKQCKKIISQKTYTWNEDSVISIAKYMLLLFYVERVTLLGVHFFFFITRPAKYYSLYLLNHPFIRHFGLWNKLIIVNW